MKSLLLLTYLIQLSIILLTQCAQSDRGGVGHLLVKSGHERLDLHFGQLYTFRIFRISIDLGTRFK